MQVPTGIIADYWGPRKLPAAGALGFTAETHCRQQGAPDKNDAAKHRSLDVCRKKD